MTKREIIKKTEAYVKKTMAGDPGHDWTHADRVRKLALYIARKEKADLFIVELGALLHDIADWKFNKGDDKLGGRITAEWLKRLKLDPEIIKEVVHIVDEVIFKGAKVPYSMRSLEGKVVQDADKLDALGAIGIARAFSFGDRFNQPLYDPKVKPNLRSSFVKHKRISATTINHFYEKLLLLKDRMHTKTAKRLAQRRHKLMELYLQEFLAEWKGPK